MKSFMQPFPDRRLLKSPSQVICTVNVSEVSHFVAPLDVISVEHVVTFPEGITLDVSLLYSVVLPTVDPILASRFTISEPFSTEIFPDTFPNDER